MNLSQKQWRGVLSVIQHLNDGLDDVMIREHAGRDLLDLLRADHFASYLWNEQAQQFGSPVFINMSPDNLRIYESYYQFHDPITPKLQQFHRAVCVQEVLAQRALVKTEFFQDFLSKDGLYYGINIYVFDNANRNIGDFRIWRSKQREPFGESEAGILDLIAPHFRNAMRNIAFARYSLPDEDALRLDMEARFHLTQREQDVAVALLQGSADRAIADALFISLATLRTHVQHIFSKALVGSRAEFCSKVLFGRAERS